jgi:hypothetical protein
MERRLMTTILQRESRMPSLAGATDWLNSEPLTPGDLQGRVVLIDFGTYTCIKCLRTLPHIRAGAEKYRACTSSSASREPWKSIRSRSRSGRPA